MADPLGPPLNVTAPVFPLKSQPHPRGLPMSIVPIRSRRRAGSAPAQSRRTDHMTGTRFTTRVLATLTLWAGFGLTAHAQLPPLTADKAFDAKPRQPGVSVATPAPAEIARHRVDPIPDPNKAGQTIGYVVRDPDGKPARQFVSYDGKGFNIIAYYAGGQEAYREV